MWYIFRVTGHNYDGRDVKHTFVSWGESEINAIHNLDIDGEIRNIKIERKGPPRDTADEVLEYLDNRLWFELTGFSRHK